MGDLQKIWAWVTIIVMVPGVMAAGLAGTFTGPQSWSVITSALCGLVGAVLLLVPVQFSSALGRDVAVVVCGGGTAVILLHLGGLGFEPAFYNLGIYLCAVVVIVGHRLIGVVGAAAVLLAGTIAGLAVDGVGMAFETTYYGLTVFILACLWRMYSERLADVDRGLAAEGVASFLTRQQEERSLVDQRIRIAMASSGAQRALGRIAGGEQMAPGLKMDVVAAEAQLRDHLRCPDLDSPALAIAVAEARRRGVKVLLVSTRANNQVENTALAADKVASVAMILRDTVSDDQVTVRRFQGTGGQEELSVVVNGQNGDTSRVDL